MIGNVWEWVEDTFEPYPGFSCDPYKEYSEPHFGDKEVLKRQRRNVFAGFRTVAR